ncbi:glyoxylate/hydroxypyruvate reductase B-like [Antedon mediterranea]|uniref:glyoxylate/hydroxypyruvate reductase B-like n=1 Tax=Antedon mediterranea TaxID=105859 RepID=UPI003AF8C40F
MMSLKKTVLVGRLMKRYMTTISSLEAEFTVIHEDELCGNTEKYANDIEGIILCPIDVFTLPKLVDMHSLPKLKIISVRGAGVDGLDVVAFRKRNVRIAAIPKVTAEPTADFAFVLMLATARKLSEAVTASKERLTIYDSAYFNLIGRNITGATIGILGMGNIGYCIAKRAMGFNMKILYHNRTRRSQLDEERVDAEYCETLEELLKQVDFLVIAVPLTTETNKLIGQKELAFMKPTSILINIGRGSVVDTDDLVDALQNGTISAAGLDVTEPEPLPKGHPLLQMQNVIITPHCATATMECIEEMSQQAVQNLKSGLSGGVINIEL